VDTVAFQLVKDALAGHADFDGFEEANRLARRRLPPSLYNDLFHGAGRGVTNRANTEAFDQVTFVPRAAVAWESRDLRTTVLGTEISMPVILAPVGSLRLANPGGAVAAARAAHAAGTICAVSMSSGHLPDAVAQGAPGAALWQQLYLFQGRKVAERIIREAKAAGFKAIIVTVDAPAMLQQRPELAISLRCAVEFGPELVRRPRWLAGFVRDGMQLAAAKAALGLRIGGTPMWDDLAWIKELWDGPVIVKGVVTAEDARKAVDLGASAVVVSNHGGLILDGSPSSLSVLPGIVAAIGDSAEVLVDSGIRRGSDVVKAVSIGAKAVLIGRSYLAGLSADGEAGVRTVLANYRRELDALLAMVGSETVEGLDSTYVKYPDSWGKGFSL
jgi:isopentenyl diphosphate isomerase/L-lactate dehydrogenase-like FMN-dependent dehydrogenase